MKNIKYRMWNKTSTPGKSKYFYDIEAVVECLKQQMLFDSGSDSPFAYDHVGEGNIFQRWTGINDNNGNLIYEGDIMQHYAFDEGDYFEVEWLDEQGEWSGHGVFHEWSSSTIVGNNCENPDMKRD